ncbi:MAG: SDR family oxidoreductase, partial [Candidatus Dadabacteria bacterium]|nr:SDR family oxidoreductase [Candidatus Dadabacteria bacterium]
GQETVRLTEDAGGSAAFIQHDVASASDWDTVVKHAMDSHGRIDVLVNNAGILVFKSLQDTEEEEWDRIVEVNAKGTFLGCKALDFSFHYMYILQQITVLLCTNRVESVCL